MNQESERVISLEQNRNERTNKGSFVFWLGIFLFAIAMDQFLKWLLFAHHYNKIIIPRVLELTNFLNKNFALSIPLPKSLMFGIYIIVLAGVLIYIIRTYKKLTSPQRLGWILILAGGISNVAERTLFGGVRDFIFLYGGAVINTADIYITAGILILIALELGRKQLQ